MSGTILLIIRLAMALALYGFLGWAVWTLWRDIKRQSELMATRRVPIIKLVNRVAAEELSYEFTTPDLVIGRDQTCDLILDEKTVSAEHARLSYHHGNWWVEDLHSRNGTLLNLELLTTSAVLTSGDELQLGQVMLQIEISGNIDRSPEKESKG
jgi:pSer/pThr/pTyr-binding forkhead associated (FHA) protein